MGREPDIIIGIGAAKAGTTWLHDYLLHHPQTHMRALKEVFHFGRTAQKDKDIKAIRTTHRNHYLRFLTKEPNRSEHFDMLRDIYEWFEYLSDPDCPPENYLSYLRLRHELNADARICADITPGYAKMDARFFELMIKTAPDAKFVYMLRDPAARLWSNCDHILRADLRRSKRAPATPMRGGFQNGTIEDVANAFLGGNPRACNQLSGHSDYASALKNLSNVVDKSRVFIGFNEKLDDGTQTANLCNFLGIDFETGNSEKRVNQGSGEKMTDDMRRRLAISLKDQYDAVEQFTCADLPAAWQASRALAHEKVMI